MNTRTKKPSTLCAALGRAGLARTGAMLALALGAAQAGATTYTVPLQFNITLAAPVCSLTVGSATATTTTAPTAHIVDLLTTSAPLAVENPQSIASKVVGTTITADAQGLKAGASGIATRLTGGNVPGASVTCTTGTPMTLTITKGSTAATNTNGTVLATGYMAGAPVNAATQPPFLPIGMLMGFWSFAGTTTASGAIGDTTWASNVPTISNTATGSSQLVAFQAALYATSLVPLNSSYAGTWFYPFNLNLNF